MLASVSVTVASENTAPRGWFRPTASRSLLLGFGPELFAVEILHPEEKAFLTKAAEFSRNQMQLAQFAQSQAANSDLRAFAQLLSTDQRQLSEAIDTLRQKKGEEPPPPTAAGTTFPDYQRLASRTGVDFDREFVRAVSAAQDAAISLFEKAAADAKDEDVRQLAGSALLTLHDHQNRLVELKTLIE